MPKYIHVANLPVKAEATDLEDFCGKHGEVSNVKLKGTKARVTMESGADAAGKALQSKTFKGNTLEIIVNHEEDWWG